jgi:hypothetical protein
MLTLCLAEDELLSELSQTGQIELGDWPRLRTHILRQLEEVCLIRVYFWLTPKIGSAELVRGTRKCSSCFTVGGRGWGWGLGVRTAAGLANNVLYRGL